MAKKRRGRSALRAAQQPPADGPILPSPKAAFGNTGPAEARAERRRLLRFLTTSAFLMLALFALFYFPYDNASWMARIIARYLDLQAWLVARMLHPFDGSVSVAGNTIGGRFPISIVKSCSCLDAQGIFVAAVVAFPTNWRRILVGLAAGVPAILLANLVRISGLYFIGISLPEYFDVFHEEVLQLFIILIAGGAFVGWAKWAMLPSVEAPLRATCT